MKKREKIAALLRNHADTAKQITETYPADWDMDAVFRKSMQKYRQMQGNTEASALPEQQGSQASPLRRKIIMHPSRLVTAACLVLTAGIAGTIGWIQVSVPEPQSVQPQNSVTTAEVEEILPVTTALAESVTQATAPDPQQTKAQTVQTQADNAKSRETLQTAPPPSGARSDEPEQKPVQGTKAQSEAAPGTAVPRQTETAARPAETKPPQTLKPAVTEQTAPADLKEEEPQPGIGDNGSAPIPAIPHENEETPNEDVEPPFNGESSGYFAYETYRGDGYRIELVENEKYAYKEYYIRFLRNDQTYYPDVEQFSVALDGYECTVEHPTPSSTRNSIVNEATGFSATVQFHGSYYSWRIVHRNITTEATTLNIGGETVPALYLTRDNSAELIWFDGMYFCNIYCKPGFYEEMRAVAEAMQTH